MKIAIPLADGRLCLHFGHCGHFALVDADPAGIQDLCLALFNLNEFVYVD